ncbi:MAG: protein translocase subunit SecD [Acidobacteria bacterium]|nr:protein translocase subunit SecD [Acidobacteriota bacterium]
MNPNLRLKLIFIVGVILACAFGLVGRPDYPTSWTNIRNNFIHNIKLGLDLQGGTHLILQVQVQEAVSLATDQAVDRLTEQLPKQGVSFQEIRKINDVQIEVRNIPAEQSTLFRDNIYNILVATDWSYSATPGSANGFTLSMSASAQSGIKERTMNTAIETIDRRINALGLTEPTIARHGSGVYEILVELPGEDDPTRAKDVIRAGGQLELRLVVNDAPFASRIDALAQMNGILPAGSELLPLKKQRPLPGQPAPPEESWLLVNRRAIVIGSDLRSATPTQSTRYPGRYEVVFQLSNEAAKRFGPFTEQNIGKHLAIILDHKVESYPVINGKIEDSGVIEGNFGQEEAKDLGLVLRAGALPANIIYLEQRTVGASLGADSIRQGIQASLVSLIAVMAFMLFYYRQAGINAVLALILNLIILLAALAYFGAVLTLPGIAGVILTIGMGVDSNVLVFERIREELRNGKAPISAVDAGFGRALLTIIDTHVTTVVSAIFLFLFGSGPIKGFAITLVIGLISNLFTAVYVSKTIFTWHLGRAPREAEMSI